MSAAPRTRERWRGIDDTVCFVAEAFFFGVFSWVAKGKPEGKLNW